MNEMQVFQSSEFGELGVLEIDGKAYFPATACAKVLGYTNPKKAIIDHCKGVTKRDLPTNGGVQKVNLISEGDLYRLIVHSRLPGAERFERWVFDEVLPTIRKQGYYAPDISRAVAQAVQMAVSEMAHALAPLIAGQMAEQIQSKKRMRRRITSAIEQLETPIRMEVEEMILDCRIGYVQISEYLRDTYGIMVSKSSIGRYASRLYDAIAAQEGERRQ